MNNNNYRPRGNRVTNRNSTRSTGARRRRRGNSKERSIGIGFAIVSLVCGFLGLASCWFFGIGTVFGIIGVVFFIIASAQGSRSRMKNAGLVLSIISIVIGAVFAVSYIFMMNKDNNGTAALNGYSIDRKNNVTDRSSVSERNNYSDRNDVDQPETKYIDGDNSLKNKISNLSADDAVIDVNNKEDAYSQIEQAIAQRKTKVYCSLELDLNGVDFEAMDYGSFWLEEYRYGDYFEETSGAFIADYYEFKYYDLSDNDIEIMKREIDESASRIIAKIPAGADEWNKAKIVHDELAALITYDLSLELPHCHDLYGALVNHNAVCSAYASAYFFILKQVGVDSKIVTYDGNVSDSHTWNIVTIDGIETHIDVTWDDPDVSYNGVPFISYTYFGLEQYEIQKEDSHMIDHISYNVSNTAPASAADPKSVNYFIHEDCYISSVSESTLTDVFTRQYKAGEKVLRVRVNNASDYQKLKSMCSSGDIWNSIHNSGYDVENMEYYCDDELMTLQIVFGDLY